MQKPSSRSTIEKKTRASLVRTPPRRIDCALGKRKSIITRPTGISPDEVVFAAIVFQSNYD